MWNAFIEAMKWIRESIRPVFVIFVLSGVCLLPPRWLSAIGISDWASAHHPIIVLVFLGAVVWLSFVPIEKLYHHQRRKRYLRRLTDEERNVLKVFVLNAKKTQSFAMNLAIARHLAQLHLLSETSTTDARGHHVFLMDGWVFSYLREHPEVVGIQINANS
jgi:superinfection exclusion protein B